MLMESEIALDWHLIRFHIDCGTQKTARLYDEINVVKPGFNSGWIKVMGPIAQSGISEDSIS